MIWMVKFLSCYKQMKNHKWGFFKISKVSELWMSNLWAWNVPLGHDRWNVEWINGFELLFCRLLAISFCNVSPLECQLCFKLCSDLPRIQKPGYLNMNLIWIFLNSSKFKWTELWTNMKTELKHFSSDYPHSFDNSNFLLDAKNVLKVKEKHTWMKVILQWQLHVFCQMWLEFQRSPQCLKLCCNCKDLRSLIWLNELDYFSSYSFKAKLSKLRTRNFCLSNKMYLRPSKKETYLFNASFLLNGNKHTCKLTLVLQMFPTEFQKDLNVSNCAQNWQGNVEIFWLQTQTFNQILPRLTTLHKISMHVNNCLICVYCLIMIMSQRSS